MRNLTGALGLACWITSIPASALEGLALYDDFSSATLDPLRWRDTERSRAVSNNALRIQERDWGLTTADGGTVANTMGDGVARPGPVTQLRANVRVNAIDLTGCAANASATRLRARILGTFFNSGNRTSGTNYGDVLAQAYLYRDSNSSDAAGVLRIEGRVSMCTGADCTSGFFFGPVADLGTVNVNTNTLLQVEWDRANKRFLFSRDKGAPVAVPYTVDDSFEPGNMFKSVGTATNVANCASGPRAFGYIDAKFDNVAVNASAKP